MEQKNGPVMATETLTYGSVTELDAAILGDEVIVMEDWQHFAREGVPVHGGTAAVRTWNDKSYVPLTRKDRCIDCLHCVVVCPHDAIGHDIVDDPVGGLMAAAKRAAALLPGMAKEPLTDAKRPLKGRVNYRHCKGCFVCGSACPTEAIRFVPLEAIDTRKFDGRSLEVAHVASIVRPGAVVDPRVSALLGEAENLIATAAAVVEISGKMKVHNGSQMMADLVRQARFDAACMYPITPNTKFLAALKDQVRKARPDAHPFTLRACISEESGYAWTTGVAAKGMRTLMAQGSQSLVQMYEHMHINPGLHLPIFLYEMTRALSPGTSIRPDHTTTMRTCDTGEIVLFGRSLQENYDRSLILLKTMESERVWLPGRLVIKGFTETHALLSDKQAGFSALTDAVVDSWLGRPTNPYVLRQESPVSLGVLDMDGRYAEQRNAQDFVLAAVTQVYEDNAADFARMSGRTGTGGVLCTSGWEDGQCAPDLILVSLDDPDMVAAEMVAEALRAQGHSCGVLSLALYRPFPAQRLRRALTGAKAICVINYANSAGRSIAQFSQEVSASLYGMERPPQLISLVCGLGGRAVTTGHFVSLFRLLHDLAADPVSSKGAAWMAANAPGGQFSLGARGDILIDSECQFNIPLRQEGIHETLLVGRGGQGIMLLASILAGVATLRGEYAVSNITYGALQRGGGITVCVRSGQERIRDFSDMILPDTIVAFDDNTHVELLLKQLSPGGTLIIDSEAARAADLQKLIPAGARLIIIPARAIARLIYGQSSRTNLVMLGAALAHMGVNSPEEMLHLAANLKAIPAIAKEAAILQKAESRKALIAGYLACRSSRFNTPAEAVAGPQADAEALQTVLKHVLEPGEDLAAIPAGKRPALYGLYRSLFHFHPMVNRLQAMFLKIGAQDDKLLSPGDMACGGCGQINIFRTVFNYLGTLMQPGGRFYVSEQDGCGTVFSGINRTSIWKVPYVRIAFETAHGVASGLAERADSKDMVICISGDGGFMQGLRSVEDALHQLDPILHIVVVNQVLGNTGGQANAATMKGAQTREGHRARRESVNFLRFAEKNGVQGAVASVVQLQDLMTKLRWAHKVVTEERKPFMLVMNFTCMEQGVNLANSLIMQKKGLEARFFNLYSLHFKEIKNSKGQVLYLKKQVTIDHFPMVFTKKAWKNRLREYAAMQGMMKEFTTNEDLLEAAYGQLRGEWEELRSEMGVIRYAAAFLRSVFDPARLTMSRLIRKSPPPESSIP